MMNETEIMQQVIGKMALNLNGNAVVHYFEIGDKLLEAIVKIILGFVAIFIVKIFSRNNK